MQTIASQINELQKMDHAQLQEKWKEIFREDPPSKLHSPKHLIQKLGHQMQVIAYGHLKPKDKQRLKHYAEIKAPQGKLVRPLAGTVITREWKGVEHHVLTLEDGFEYQNIKYKSLSQVARAITGTVWSGPVFFGLKRKGDKQ